MKKMSYRNAVAGARFLRAGLTVLAAVALNACSTALSHLPGVYSLEIQQGNIVTQEMVDQLRPGMNKRQVLYIMGSPMLLDPFHQNRWDYIYSVQPSGEDRLQKQVSLYFEGDQIVGIQGDFRPGTAPPLKVSPETTVDVPRREVEKTLWEMLTGWVDDDDADDSKRDQVEQTRENRETPL